MFVLDPVLSSVFSDEIEYLRKKYNNEICNEGAFEPKVPSSSKRRPDLKRIFITKKRKIYNLAGKKMQISK